MTGAPESKNSPQPHRYHFHLGVGTVTLFKLLFNHRWLRRGHHQGRDVRGALQLLGVMRRVLLLHKIKTKIRFVDWLRPGALWFSSFNLLVRIAS